LENSRRSLLLAWARFRCTDCGGRRRFVAAIEDGAVIEKILRHLELPIDPPAPAPARAAAWLPGFETATNWIRN
jgi:hypothetical protein